VPARLHSAQMRYLCMYLMSDLCRGSAGDSQRVRGFESPLAVSADKNAWPASSRRVAVHAVMLRRVVDRARVAVTLRSAGPGLLGTRAVRRVPTLVRPLHVKRGDDGGNPLIGLAALGAAGAGFAAVKAVALSMEAGDAEVVVGLQKHAREMGIEEGLIAEVMDTEDSQAALTELILDMESALCLNRGSDGEIVHRDIARCVCDMCKRTLSNAQAHIACNIVDEHWPNKSERPPKDTQPAIRDAVTTALRTAGHLMTYTERHMECHMYTTLRMTRPSRVEKRRELHDVPGHCGVRSILYLVSYTVPYSK
jgi:hypothetical protein